MQTSSMDIERLTAYFQDFSGESLFRSRYITPDSLTLPQKKSRIQAYLKEQIGKPFELNSSSENAFDCSGLIQGAYRAAEVDLPRVAIHQATFGGGRPLEYHEELEVGDLFYFTSYEGRYNEQYPMGIGHSAIYSGEGTATQARYRWGEQISESGVVEVPVDYLLNMPDLVVILRILE